MLTRCFSTWWPVNAVVMVCTSAVAPVSITSRSTKSSRLAPPAAVTRTSWTSRCCFRPTTSMVCCSWMASIE